MSISAAAVAVRPTPPLPRGADSLGAWFDHAAADAAVTFFGRYLRHTEAEWWGKPFRLASWQEHDIIRPVFGWKRADGTRLIRVVYIEVPRKNGKTELAAGVSLLALLGDGEFGGQGYSMAVDKDQAKIVFNKAGVMVGLSPELSQMIEVYKTSLYCAELAASFKPLSSAPGSKHGFSPSFAVGDELHEWPDGELHDVVHKGMAARRQPLEVLITTAGQPHIGYGWQLHEYAQQVIAGEVEDPAFHAVIYAAGPQDDWTDPKVWAKANPNFGVSVKEDFLREECQRAIGKARKEGDFKRYHLNIWTDQVLEGIDMPAWDGKCNLRPVPLEALAGRRCWGGLDLSSTTDLTGLVLVSPYEDGSDGYDVWAKAWMPTDRIMERVRGDRVAYDQWIAEGWIIGTEGDTVDYDAVRWCITGKGREAFEPTRQMREIMPVPVIEMVDLAELAIDRWNASQITTQLGADGLTVVPFGQGYGSMSGPCKELERLVGKGGINHGGNPVLRWMASCVQFDRDKRENLAPVKPDRRKTAKRIDLIVALLMALGRAPKAEAPKGPSVYEQRGILMV